MMIENISSLNNTIVRSSLNPFYKVFNISEHFLIEEFKNTNFKEVIFLASPILFEEVSKYIENNTNKDVKKKIFISLAKYYQRYSTRCTPFGMFSAVSVIPLKEKTSVNYSRLKRTTRIDNFFISQFIQVVEKKQEFREGLKYKLNSSFYNLNDSYRYIESKILTFQKKYEISSIEKDIYIEKIVNNARGYQKFNYYVECLVDDEIAYDDSKDFINLLIDSQILISNLEPSIVTDNPISEILKVLNELNTNNVSFYIAIVENVQNILNQIDSEIFSLDIYEKLYKEIDKLGIDYNKSKLVQVDCYLDAESSSLNKEVFTQILDVFPILNRNYIKPKSNLDAFMETFSKRYDTTIQPLTIVLDPDLGIKYPQHFDKNEIVTKEIDIFKIFYENIGKDVLYLDDKDITRLNINKDNMQASFNAVFSLVKSEESEMILFDFVGGNSANDLFGRFTHLNDNIYDLVNKIAKHEIDFYEDFIIAEILHLPESRTGNILFRKKIYDYNISYLANSTLDEEFEINIQDINIEIIENIVFLVSKKHNKYIIPRLNNAHNYDASTLPIYRFLCDVQNQSKIRGLSFNFGKILNNISVFPRVVYKNIILFPKTWVLENSDINYIKEIFSKKIFETKFKLPKIFLLINGDNNLFVNLDNELSVQCFLDEIKKSNRIILREYFFPSDNIKNINGEVCSNEFHLPFINKNKGLKAPKKENVVKTKDFLTDDNDWVYFKIYGGNKILEKILTSDIDAFANKFSSDIEKWFFIRYYDDEYGHHLRIRFLSPTDSSRKNILYNFINEINYYVKNEYVYKFSIDTYRRENSRYVIKNFDIECSESFFHYDSIYILSILKLPNINNDLKHIIGMLNIEYLLNAVDYNIEQKLEFTSNLRKSFYKEFGEQKNHAEFLKDKYRNNKNLIDSLFPFYSNSNDYPELHEIHAKRNIQTKNIFDILKNNEFSDINFILSSYIHMSLNRLFMKDNRWNEFIVYDFLSKYYKSIKSRKLYDKINNFEKTFF
ncbi:MULTISPECIES: lantibiotic dehydratase [Flavobacterium]|uniref:Lantibiotic dehydratase n=1 Tax=Flavobacterium hankyongi TaxID=1176532 RepID=A0ABP8ZQC6_9FLAO|nr:lantibiotic dehydratase [Flavobacterium sp. N1846]